MFSVIVPTYNRPELLKILLSSLSLQNFAKDCFEVIVVYTPGDTSEDFLKKHISSFKLIPLCIDDPVFQGKSASIKRNSGAAIAKYDWLAFIDDDCIADENWLSNAQLNIKQTTAGIEGQTLVPLNGKPTFTYKGLKFLSRFGGFQTCNMFYKKNIFDDIGGFDPNLPFYLEDTDLAWSFLEKNHILLPAKDVIVTHPVPHPNVHRWLENAVRCRKIPYLAKKHPILYNKMNFKALPRSSFFFMGLFLLIVILSVLFSSIVFFLFGLLTYFSSSFIYVFYLLRNCDYKWMELLQMLMYHPLVPPISSFQLLRGCIEQRIFIY